MLRSPALWPLGFVLGFDVRDIGGFTLVFLQADPKRGPSTKIAQFWIKVEPTDLGWEIYVYGSSGAVGRLGDIMRVRLVGSQFGPNHIRV